MFCPFVFKHTLIQIHAALLRIVYFIPSMDMFVLKHAINIKTIMFKKFIFSILDRIRHICNCPHDV